ncbi:MAG: preprotein translocase subunit SecA [Alphaproteobacteria bacterium]|nr:preprotein translocase subunit SecA [Alphaproteobacteria bacterium]
MIGTIARKVFGTQNSRIIKKLQPTVNRINELEPELEELSDDEIKQRTDWLKKRYEDGETLDQLLEDAFATVREASKRTLGLRHFDVQLIGGITLHRGLIAEMKTGEGKTLVATLTVYLNALSGKGVHVVTVNDYLAQRDAEWMGQVYEFLGLSVGCIVHGLEDHERKEIYSRDVVYATNNELGFDYLRDNMKYNPNDIVQRDFNYAIVDEVDSILIDEARTPLIISGAAEDSSQKYIAVNKLIPLLDETHYEKDEKQRSITLTEEGSIRIEELLNEAGLIEDGSLYDVANISLVHHSDQALRAHHMFQRDVDYIVKDNKLVIIDEFTGRMMEGRRFSDGLHQALEAKEGVDIMAENQTLASITFQNYFRLYPKLAGMTGTAMTEAAEFDEIYELTPIEIPTNIPVTRIDYDDEIYKSETEKYASVIELVKDCTDRKQPVLVGTTSIEKSEELARLLQKTKIKFEILNARHHEREAYIIAQAGVPGAVTIATNMAGRGTDIKLGGNLEMRIAAELSDITDEKELKRKTEEIEKDIEKQKQIALDAGGLYVICTERHESRRIDNQLRGRSGRQGDPGASKFFLSLDDDLMRIFGSERMEGMLVKLGLKEGEAITHPWVNKALEKAQQKVEARNFDIRKNLLKYDDVMNDQRKVIYKQRRDLMQDDDVNEIALEMRHDILMNIANETMPDKAPQGQWDLEQLHEKCFKIAAIDVPVAKWLEEGLSKDEIIEKIISASDKKMAAKVANYGADLFKMVSKSMMLQTLDQLWKEHLLTLDYIRHTIMLRAYGQKDPLNEYKSEAFMMFEYMLDSFREKMTTVMSHIEIRMDETPEEIFSLEKQQDMSNYQETHETPKSALTGEPIDPEKGIEYGDARDPKEHEHHPFRYANGADFNAKDPNTWGKVSRNAPCPCGSGKKYKHCHGHL